MSNERTVTSKDVLKQALEELEFCIECARGTERMDGFTMGDHEWLSAARLAVSNAMRPAPETFVRPYEQVMKQAEREGVDAQDLIATLMKKVEDQRRELARLNVEHRTAVGTRVPVTDRRGESAISEEGVPLCSALKASEVREWHFDRYRAGKLKAQGVKVHAVTEADAWVKAKELLHIDGNLPTDELRLSQNGLSARVPVCPECGRPDCACGQGQL